MNTTNQTKTTKRDTISNKKAADAELDDMATESDRLDAELTAELATTEEPTEAPATITMTCDHACGQCGDCPDRVPQTLDADDTEIIDLLATPCDCERLNVEVRHVTVTTETKVA
jgi:hypothetical protein